MNTTPAYSFLHLTGNLERLSFINKRNFSVPSPPVTLNSARLCLLLHSATAKHRGPTKDMISILSVSFVGFKEYTDLCVERYQNYQP